nr:two-component regulator propeller domain-containing protein [Aestuariivivens sediminicola]
MNKYDGKSFKYYNKHFEDVTKVNYSKLGKIYIDRQNEMWIITNSGHLEKYLPDLDDFIEINNLNAVSILIQDTNHTRYFGTYGHGIHVAGSNRDTIQILKPEDEKSTIYAFSENKDHIYATSSNHIYKISKLNFDYSKIAAPKNEPINFSALLTSPDHSLWIGSFGHGLYHYDGTGLKRFNGFRNATLPTDLNIETLLLDRNERLWVGTYGKGIYIIDFNTKRIDNYTVQYSNPYALHYNDILCTFTDNTGNIWVGTDGAGLSYYDEHLLKFNVLTNNQLPQNINVDVTRAITVNPKNNNLILGTSGKGLTFIDREGKTYKTYTTENSSFASNRVMSLKFIDQDLWIGYQDMGLDILEPNGSITHYNHNSKIKFNTNAVWCIYEDSAHSIWLGTGGQGLIRFDKNLGIMEHYTHNPFNNASIPSNNIRAITAGRDHELWIGTEDNGICLFNTTTKHIDRVNSIPKKIKSLFYEKDKGVLWVGTNGNGLIKFNVNSQDIRSYTTEDGLPNNVIYGILKDDDGVLWLSSNHGITMFKETASEPQIINYDKYDGLQAFEFNTGAYFKDHNKNLYFGGIAGVNWFQPEQLTLNQVKPKTIITELLLFNKPLKAIPNLELKHKDNTIAFKFASLHYSQPNLNSFKYKLENHDLDWIDAGNNTTANYSNLAPDTYTFKVISSNYDGVWNETPANYTFTIRQAWYKTTTAIVIYVILLAFLLWSIYHYFKWRWHMQTQLTLKNTETERLKNLDEFKSKLFTNISHEFRTPLTLILGPAENQLAQPNLPKENREELSLIKQNAKRLLNLVDQLIDLAKLESGHLKLKVEQGHLSILIHQIVGSFKFKIEQKKIRLKSKITTINDAWYDKDVVEKIIINLMANAVKYTPKKGKIHINAVRQDGFLILTLLNNGCTIGPQEVNQLFNRFYQVNPNTDGFGIGLALVKELIALTKGNLIAHLVNKDELQFTVTLPITRGAFDDEHILLKSSDQHTEKLNDYDVIDEPIEDIDMRKDDKRPIILVVEDNMQLRQYIKTILKSAYKVLLAANGKTGIEKAIKKIPDVIISDVMMPKADGIELCKTLKNNTLTSHIPIILLTAKTGENNELEGLEVGADDFLTKPFNSKILTKRIENFINLSQSLQKRYTQFSILAAKDIAISNLDEAFLNEVETVFKNHLADPDFNAQGFSKHMAMSRMQLHRKLMALTGLSTTQFIKSQRLKTAIKLLQNTDLSISEIAYQVGFNSVSYFIKCFKETYNTTPKSYVKL